MDNKINIDENVFMDIATKEKCRAYLSERRDAVAPTYVKYSISANEIFRKEIYPTWRTNDEQTKYIGKYQSPRSEALPITFHELALRPNLFAEIGFDLNKNYFQSNNIIVFHCSSCGIYLVKDGNHRLLQCAVHGTSSTLTIYEVASNDWSRCKVDMKNFCKCILIK